MIPTIITLFALIATARQPTPTGPTVMAKVRPGPVFVGQGVEVTVGVAGTTERPRVTVPTLEGASITLNGTELRPISTSAIGDQVFGRNFYRFRYRVVPRRAGTLTIPPFLSSVAEKSGASTPLKIQVRAVPQAGRTSEFLGGVGNFAVDATAEPASVRRGQVIAYRIEVRGPAALGINAAPALKRLPRGLEIERKADVVSADSETHTFVYAVRPTEAGGMTIPPVRISAFDPESERYVTRVAPGVPIKVTDVAAFNPARVSDPEPIIRTAGESLPRIVVAVSTAALAGVAILILGMRWKRFRAKHLRSRRRVEAVRDAGSDAELARVVAEALVGYLSQSVDREPGALTPGEAEEGVERATGSAPLAAMAREVVERCDAVLYGNSAAESIELRRQAITLFETLVGTA